MLTSVSGRATNLTASIWKAMATSLSLPLTLSLEAPSFTGSGELALSHDRVLSEPAASTSVEIATPSADVRPLVLAAADTGTTTVELVI